MQHKDNGARCLVSHYSVGPCMQCSNCEDWIPDGHYNDECPFDPNQNQETCEHLTWDNRRWSMGRSAMDWCTTCHKMRERSAGDNYRDYMSSLGA